MRDGSRRSIRKQKQVRKRGQRYRGCDGTCVGVTGQICVGDSRDRHKVFIQFNAVAYAGLFLTGRALE